MRFRVVGARRDSGEDVNLLIEARDESSVQRWAIQHGILWTSILPAPQLAPPPAPTAASPKPQTQPATKAKPYEAEKDSVIWLIGVVGVLLCLLVSSQHIGISDPSKLGATLGAATGAFLFVFLFGLIGSKIAGKHARPSRIGFTIGAMAALAIFIVGESRIRNNQEQEVEALAQRLGPARNMPDTTRAPSPVSQTTIPINSMSAGEAADVKVLLAEVEKIQQEARTKGETYQARINAIAGGTDLINARNFDTLEKIVAVKSKMTQMRELIDAQEKLVQDMFRTMPGRLKALPISTELKLSTLQGYETTAAHSEEMLRRAMQSERKFTVAVTDLADFFQSHFGHFQLEGDKVVFDDATTLAGYNGLLIRIQLLRKEAAELMTTQEQMREHAAGDIEKLKQFK